MRQKTKELNEEFIKKHQGKHFCKHCDEEIIIKPFHRGYYGIPDYINGHHNKTKGAKEVYSKRLRENNPMKKLKVNSGSFKIGYTPIFKGKTKENYLPLKKASEKMTGDKNPMKREKTKEKMRISTIKRIERQFNNSEPMLPCIGKNETQILDRIEIQESIKIIRQYKVIGYFVDGYCKESNVVYEIDESSHNSQKVKVKDLLRQKEIEKELGCKFIRIKDNIIK